MVKKWDRMSEAVLCLHLALHGNTRWEKVRHYSHVWKSSSMAGIYTFTESLRKSELLLERIMNIIFQICLLTKEPAYISEVQPSLLTCTAALCLVPISSKIYLIVLLTSCL